MKYLCLCYYDTQKFANLSKKQMEEIGKACPPHDAALRATGGVITQGSLSMPDAWKVIKPRDGKPVVSDGPYIVSNQQAGAFLIVEAMDLAEAVRIASKHAAANYGEHLGFAVEVRECEMFESQPAKRE